MQQLTTILFALITALLLAGPVVAQPGAGLEELVPPPKLLLRHQSDLELTDKQKDQLKDVIKDAQSQSLDLEFEVQEEAEKLAKLLGAQKVDEKKALAQADELMKLEAKLKRVRLQMLIRTKNVLTSDQLAKIDEFRKQRRQGRQDRQRRRGRR